MTLAMAPPDIHDRRGSWVPTLSMITTRAMEIRRRRGLMIALAVVTIGIPCLFLAIRLIAHGADPKAYGPAGGYDIYTAMVAGVLYVFGFIMAATVGANAGSTDLTDGMFRHLVITGRSRVALYLARIPAGLAIVCSMVAVGFTIVCVVCVFAAPTSVDFDGVQLPAGLTMVQLENFAAHHVTEVLCDFSGPTPLSVNCGGPGPGGSVHVIHVPPGVTSTPSTQAQLRADAESFARSNYRDYARMFLTPSTTLMVESGLWVELEALIGFMVGLGLASLLGQRTVAVILMIILEIILTPLLAREPIAHLINLQRGLVGLGTAHLEPSALPRALGGGGPNGMGTLVPEPRLVAVLVIVGWLVVWTALGAWRMAKREA